MTPQAPGRPADEHLVLRLHGPGDVRLHREPPPTAGPGETLLRVASVGLCGSDRHWYLEAGIGDAGLTRPLVLGHEFSAVVAEGPRAGERVAVDPAIPCESCATCLAGLSHLCESLPFSGSGRTDGALRELMAWPTRHLYPIPDAIPEPEASLLEPLGIALHAIDLGKVLPGSRTTVHGCGPIGLLLVRALNRLGCHPVVATDPLPHRVDAARRMGADHAFVTTHPASDEDAIRSVTAGPGVDVAFEVAGRDDAIESGLRALRPGGRLVIVGIPDDDRTSFPAALARRKGVSVLVSRRMAGTDLPRAITLVASGWIDLGGVVTHRYPLSEAGEAFGVLRERRGLKVVVEPGRTA